MLILSRLMILDFKRKSGMGNRGLKYMPVAVWERNPELPMSFTIGYRQRNVSGLLKQHDVCLNTMVTMLTGTEPGFVLFFERFGIEKMKHLFEEELKDVINQGIPQCLIPVESNTATNDQSSTDYPEKNLGNLDYCVQKQKDYIAVPIRLSGGLIHADDFAKLIDIVESYSDKQDLRTTQNQDFLLTYIRSENLKKLQEELKQLKQDVLTLSSIPFIVTCPGPSTCRLGICNSRGAAEACGRAIDKASFVVNNSDGIDIKISGCPNACGQHLISSIGFSGLIRHHNKHSVPSYKIIISFGKNPEILQLGETIGTIPAKLLPEFLVRVLTDYKENQEKDEVFPAYAKRQGADYLKNLTCNYSVLPDYSSDPELYCDWERESIFTKSNVVKTSQCGSISKDLSKTCCSEIDPGNNGTENSSACCCNQYLDLRGVGYNESLEKSKATLAKVPSGNTICLLLDNGIPARDVPAYLEEEAHVILKKNCINNQYWLFHIQKKGDGK